MRSAQVDDVPTANVKPLEYKLEQGAALHVLRPAKFIDPDETYWNMNTKKYTQATGIEVKVDLPELGGDAPAGGRHREYRRRA